MNKHDKKTIWRLHQEALFEVNRLMNSHSNSFKVFAPTVTSRVLFRDASVVF